LLSGQDEKVVLRFVSHPSEDEWEEYALGRLPEKELARVEEHLLACASCQSTLEGVDSFIQSMRSASPHAVEPPMFVPSRGIPKLERWIPFQPRAVMAALALGLVLASVFLVRSRSELPVAFVTLASFRGEATASAPLGRALNLEISQSDIPLEVSYTVEVVTQSGNSQWKGAPERTGGKLIGRLPRGLGKGTYWVRLFGPRAELIREFGLRVE
jgi:anti-sigma factor RsiW